MQKLAFVDSYMHCFDYSNPKLSYVWKQPNFNKNTLVGKVLEKLIHKNFLIDDYLKETRGANIIAAVHSEAAATRGPLDPVTETEWLQREANRTGFPHAIVGNANLMDPNVERLLERHCQSPNMRGIRHFSPGDFLADPEYHRRHRVLKKYKLTSELNASSPDAAKLHAVAKLSPDIPLALTHMGMPAEWTPESVEVWRKGLRALSPFENLSLKISALVLKDQKWTVDSLRPRVLDAVEAVGPKRVMFATHWPLDVIFGSAQQLTDAYREIIKDFSLDEQKDMLSRNALKFYRIAGV